MKQLRDTIKATLTELESIKAEECKITVKLESLERRVTQLILKLEAVLDSQAAPKSGAQ